jgi:MoaA/NifB/PqqE/SkfB family radical SAM enzyme
MGKHAENLKEFTFKPLLLRYSFRPVRYYFTHMLPYRQDLFTLLNWHLFHRRGTGLKMQVPKEMMIVPSTICNGRCVFCSYRKLQEHGSMMPQELFKRVIDEYYALGGRRISLCPTVGECLLDPLIFEKIKYAKEKGFFVYTFSNAIILGINDNYKKLIDAGLDELFISLGDVVPEIESEIFGIPVTLAQKKIEGIKALLDYLEQSKKPLKLTLGFRSKRPFSQIWKDMKANGMARHFKAKRFKIGYVLGYDNWGGSIAQSELLGMQRLKRVVKFKRFPCAKLLYVSVLPDGDVRLCGCRVKDSKRDGLTIGNLKDASLKDILFSGRVEEIAKGFTTGNPPDICRDCSFYCPHYK